MTEKVKAKYVGPGMAILAGRAIYTGEAREVTNAQLEHARLVHPNGFVIVGEEPGSVVDEHLLDDLTVSDIKEVASETEDLEYLRRLLAIEQSGEKRKTAIAALVDRITELETAAQPVEKESVDEEEVMDDRETIEEALE